MFCFLFEGKFLEYREGMISVIFFLVTIFVPAPSNLFQKKKRNFPKKKTTPTYTKKSIYSFQRSLFPLSLPPTRSVFVYCMYVGFDDWFFMVSINGHEDPMVSPLPSPHYISFHTFPHQYPSIPRII